DMQEGKRGMQLRHRQRRLQRIHQTVAAERRRCDTVGMRRKYDSSRREPLSLRTMLRRERRNRFIVLAVSQATALLTLAVFMFGVATHSEALVCSGCTAFLILLMLIFPFALSLERFDSTRTWEHLRFNLKPIGDPDDLIDCIDAELADASHV